MNIQNGTMVSILSTFLASVYSTAAFSAETETQQPYGWPWWQEHHAHPFWWIFPLLFFVIMIVFMILMMRRGRPWCMWRYGMMDRPEIRNSMKQYWGESSESALEILDKRYAKGEIDKQEYEEKKVAISHKS